MGRGAPVERHRQFIVIRFFHTWEATPIKLVASPRTDFPWRFYTVNIYNRIKQTVMKFQDVFKQLSKISNSPFSPPPTDNNLKYYVLFI